MSIYSTAEKNIKQLSRTGVNQLLRYFGLQVEVNRLQATVYTDVYGTSAGGPVSSKSTTITAVLVGDDFFEANDAHTGNFQQGWMYLSQEDEDKVMSGDIIKLVRDDSSSFRYKVGKIDSLGFTTRMFKRYELVSLGD